MIAITQLANTTLNLHFVNFCDSRRRTFYLFGENAETNLIGDFCNHLLHVQGFNEAGPVGKSTVIEFWIVLIRSRCSLNDSRTLK